MTDENPNGGFREYFGRMLGVVSTCSLALSLLVAAILFGVGEFSMDLDVGVELDRMGAVVILVGLPAVAIIVFALMSPLSWLIYRLVVRLTRRGDG